MRIRKIITKPGDDHDGVHTSGGVQAVVSANVGSTRPSRTRVSSRQRIVQRDGRTEVHEHQVHEEHEGDEHERDEDDGATT